MKLNETLLESFPNFLRKELSSALEKYDFGNEIENYRSFSVILRGESLEIPRRVYFEKPTEFFLNQSESLIFNCLFTRHHNGFIRERCLREIILKDDYWIAPFVVQLLGEYVIEILKVIDESMNPKLLENISNFVVGNPKFYDLTKSRVISYWSCYYRHSFPNKQDYVGCKILTLIENHLSKNNS